MECRRKSYILQKLRFIVKFKKRKNWITLSIKTGTEMITLVRHTSTKKDTIEDQINYACYLQIYKS